MASQGNNSSASNAQNSGDSANRAPGNPASAAPTPSIAASSWAPGAAPPRGGMRRGGTNHGLGLGRGRGRGRGRGGNSGSGELPRTPTTGGQRNPPPTPAAAPPASSFGGGGGGSFSASGQTSGFGTLNNPAPATGSSAVGGSGSSFSASGLSGTTVVPNNPGGAFPPASFYDDASTPAAPATGSGTNTAGSGSQAQNKGSSGSGFRGRGRGRGDGYSHGNRGRGNSGRGSFAGVSRNRGANPNSLIVAPRVCIATYREQETGQETGMSVHLPGGGGEVNVVAYDRRGTAILSSNNPQHNAEVARQVMVNTGSRRYVSITRGVPEGVRALAQRRQWLRSVMYSDSDEPDRRAVIDRMNVDIPGPRITEVTDDSSGPKTPPAPQTAPAQQSAPEGQETKCGNCGLTTHTIAHCLMAEDGVVRGCPICNVKGHHLGECNRATNLEKVKAFVTDRANQPPLQATQRWEHALYEWLENENGSKGNKIPERFPWSIEYTKEQSLQKLRDLQDTFEVSNFDWTVLPVDDTTKDCHSLWRNFWMPRQYPRRLVEWGYPAPLNPAVPEFVPGNKGGHTTAQQQDAKADGEDIGFDIDADIDMLKP